MMHSLIFSVLNAKLCHFPEEAFLTWSLTNALSIFQDDPKIGRQESSVTLSTM